MTKIHKKQEAVPSPDSAPLSPACKYEQNHNTEKQSRTWAAQAADRPLNYCDSWGCLYISLFKPYAIKSNKLERMVSQSSGSF